jgi:hypothetical protein
MPRLTKTQIINETANWICFTPDREITKGHVCFYSDKHQDDATAFSKMYQSAVKYAESMKDIGFYTNYHLYFFDKLLHLVPCSDNGLPEGWVAHLTEIDSNVKV